MPPQRAKEAHSASRGRHLVATSALQPGDVILLQEPYAAVLYDEQCAELCDWTFQRSTTLSRCSGCKLVRYSSKAAQRAAWAAGHKQECRALAAAAPRVPPASVRLAARVLWRAAREQAERVSDTMTVGAPVPEGRTGAGSWAEVELLQHHWDSLDDDRKTLFAQMAVLTRQYMLGEAASDSAVGAPARDVAQLLARFACNNHTVCDEELRAIGVGLYPKGALINHSRDFNAVQSFDGAAIRFAAVQRLEAGAEITISYLDLKCTRPERRTFLQKHYHFDIDGGAPLPPPPAWREPALGRARCEWRPVAPLGPLDPADVHLTALQSPGDHMLALQHHAAPLSAAGVPGLEGIAGVVQGRLGGAGSGSGTPHQPGSHVTISFWGPGLSIPGDDGAALPSPAAATATRAAVQAFEALGRAERLLSSGDAAGAADTLQAALTGVGKVVGPRHVLVVRLLEGHVRASLAAGDRWPAALASAQHLQPLCTLIYPHVNSPELGLLWATIAKVAALLEEDPVAMTAAEAAAQCLHICSGGTSSVAAEMRQLRHDIGAQVRVLHDL